MGLQTTLRTGMCGWTAECLIPLEGLAPDRQGATPYLRVSTYKSDRGTLNTVAAYCEQAGAFMCQSIFRDYHVTLLQLKGRGTEKAIMAQHEAALSDIDQHIAACVQHQMAAKDKEA
jgi:hypothetical protein